jgi:outer membrane protein assembly factor BamB
MRAIFILGILAAGCNGNLGVSVSGGSPDTDDAGGQFDLGGFDLPLAPDPAAPWSGGAVAFQIDPMHRGAQQDTMAPPLMKKWSIDLGPVDISYPLIADGKVFVTTGNQEPKADLKLFAFDEATGSVVWSRDIDPGGWGLPAYDQGHVYVADRNGVTAFDSATGAQLWRRVFDDTIGIEAAPVATAGMVFVAVRSYDMLWALNGTTGQPYWSADVQMGIAGPTVGGGAVYMSLSCSHAYAFDLHWGSPIWATTPCSGGITSYTAVLAGDRLYVRDTDSGDAILQASSGAKIGGFASDQIPAVDATRAFFVRNGQLIASGGAGWSFAGDGMLSTAPIVVNGIVYIGSWGGNVFGVDASTGNQVWTDRPSFGVPPTDETMTGILSGLAAADHLLVVPAYRNLVAYSDR